MRGARTRQTPFRCDVECRACKGQHEVSGTVELHIQPILFGGGSGAKAAEYPFSYPVTCPVTQEVFEATLMLPMTETETPARVVVDEVTGVDAPPAAPDQLVTPASSPALEPARDWIDEELAEWRKTSVANARTYATTMLTTASGAVAVYFAVLKYLGFEQQGKGPWAWVAGLPPVLFLASGACFAYALRPSMSYVERSEYVEFRAGRIRQMHQRSTWGVAAYGLGTLVAVAVFLWLL